jgi:hypothetical protein
LAGNNFVPIVSISARPIAWLPINQEPPNHYYCASNAAIMSNDEKLTPNKPVHLSDYLPKA